MNNKESIFDKLYKPTLQEIGRVFFYIGLTLEIFIFLYDRSAAYNPYQSLMFRITFCIFAVKCALTRYSKKEWIFIILLAAFSILTYRLSGKDEVVRSCVFIVAMKGLDIRRSLRFTYYLTSFGIGMMGLLSILGVMGNVMGTGAYGDKEGLRLFEFGMGSPNTWAIQIWLLIALYIFLYHDVMHPYSYGIFLALGIVVYLLSRCRTELIMVVFTCVAGFFFERFKKLGQSASVYIVGALLVLFSVGFSAYAAAISVYPDDFATDAQRALNSALTGRISSIYAFENGGGVLSNWKLFGSIDFTEYFDMGYVRLFWWYGIIPGTLAVISVLILFWHNYKKRDHATFLFVLSMCLFTLLEAHFISPFIARSYYLFIIGGTWYIMLDDLSPDKQSRPQHIAFYIGALSKGGAERVFINLAEYFLSEGYEVSFITQYEKENEYPLPEGADRYISDLTKAEESGRIQNFFKRIIKLHGIIRSCNPDLIMTTIGKSNFMAIVCSAFLPARVVVSVVAEPSLEYPTRIMRILAQTLFAEADGIVMQTARQQRFLRYGLRQKSVILPNSVSPDFVKPRYEGKRRQNLYMVGRLDDNKNQVMAISAIARIAQDYPNVRLIICGDGPKRDALRFQADYFNISNRCEFTGSIDDVPDRLSYAYAFLLTSDTEGMPNTLLEAMSLGVPCISTDCPCGGPAQIIEDGVNGILIEVGDTYGLVRAITRLLDDPEYASKLGANAYETMKEYRPDKVNALWRAYFDGIICPN